jgi:hypothetical protein
MLSVHVPSTILKEHVSGTRYLHRRMKGWGRTYSVGFVRELISITALVFSNGCYRVDASPLLLLGTDIEPVSETCDRLGN